MSTNIPYQMNVYELQKLIQSDFNKLLLIDVREEEELEIAKFPFEFTHLPLSKLSQFDDSLDNLFPTEKKVIVICHAGVRSQHFAYWLIENCYVQEISNLLGGIDAWSQAIDSSIARY